MKKNNYGVTILVAIVVAAAAFFGGMKYQETKAVASSQGGQFYTQGMKGGQGGQTIRQGGQKSGMMGGGATIGEILNVDGTSVTVKLSDGSSKIVNLSEKTTISKTATAAATELKAGEKIAAFGESNSDGSITAQNIQLNPMFRTNVEGQAGQGMMKGTPVK
jgi:hypothetical protein